MWMFLSVICVVGVPSKPVWDGTFSRNILHSSLQTLGFCTAISFECIPLFSLRDTVLLLKVSISKNGKDFMQQVASICSNCHNKIPLPGWLKNRHLHTHSSRCWKSNIEVSRCLVSPEALLSSHV